MEKYKIRYIGQLHWFLDIRVIHDRKQRKIWLCQDSYIKKISKSFNLQYMKPARIPMDTEELQPYKEKASPEAIHLY